MTRRISSSRPMTGSILPVRARAVRSCPYLERASYVASGLAEVTRWEPRTAWSAARIALRSNPTAANAGRSEGVSASASSTCSADTKSSFIVSASSLALSKSAWVSEESPGWPAACASLGRRASWPATAVARAASSLPARRKSEEVTPPSCVSRPCSRCAGSSAGLRRCIASLCACWRASEVFSVRLP